MTAGFAARYPRVWHVMEAEGEGCEILYPAAELRRLALLPEDNANRADFQKLDLPGGGAAVLRKQLMPDARLTPTLAGPFSGRPDLWRAHINQHVFFWVSEDRRDRFISACARLRSRGVLGAGAPPVVLTFDTATLLAERGDAAWFSVINTGSTVRAGAWARRDEATFRPIQDWRAGRAVELAIRAPVPLASLHAVS